ncbi:MAG: hypothetical protein R3200_14175 [Xanthomonadales bacterium]|nr:hypothetical protein [Xanthomonadales bacterium]
MSNLLSFITSFGSSAELRSLSEEELRAIMAEHGLSREEQEAILSGDATRITEIARTPGDIKCCVAPQEPDDDEDDEEDEDDDGDESEEIRRAGVRQAN